MNQGAPAPNPDVPDMSMAEIMRQVTSSYTSATTEADMSDDDEQLAPRRRKHLKSGLHRTGATMVLN